MCGASVATEAKQCPSCGESFLPQNPKATMLKSRVTTAGAVPGAVVGITMGLISLAGACSFSADFRNDLDPIVLAVFLSCGVVFGAAGGAAVSGVLRAIRTREGDS